MASRPDPEVVAKAKRRTYTAEYKQRILAEPEAAAATRGSLGALLRREGLYSSLLTYWRRERADGILEALTPRKRGPKSKRNPLEEENQTKAMASLASFRDLFGDVCGKRDFDAARKCGVPLRQMPRAGLVLKLTALNEGRLDADLGAQQVFPVVPTRIPRQW
jgi:transposase-like protein